jgi:hypothetical protein
VTHFPDPRDADFETDNLDDGTGDPDPDDGEEPIEPDAENDAFVASDGFKLTVSFAGKFLGTFQDEDDAWAAVDAEEDAGNYFPTRWFVDDHGGFDLRCRTSATPAGV